MEDMNDKNNIPYFIVKIISFLIICYFIIHNFYSVPLIISIYLLLKLLLDYFIL